MANRTGSVRSPGRYRLPVMLAALAIVSACSLAPTYEVPPAPVAAQYRTLGPWVSAEPADEHTSELQSLAYLVCRLLLEKTKTNWRRTSANRAQTLDRSHEELPVHR